MDNTINVVIQGFTFHMWNDKGFWRWKILHCKESKENKKAANVGQCSKCNASPSKAVLNQMTYIFHTMNGGE